MTHMPITSTKPQPSGNTASALSASAGADDSLATDAYTAANPFAFLLAQQIGEAELSIPDAVRIAMENNTAEDSANLPMSDAQDAAIIAASAPDDPANMLAAILMRPPVQEDNGEKAGGLPATPLAENPHDARSLTDPATLNGVATTLAEAPHDVRSLTPASYGYKKPAPDPENYQRIQLPEVGHPSAEAAKRAELPPGLVQPVQNAAQAPALPTAVSAMPGVLIGNTPGLPPPGSQPTVATPLGNHGWAEDFSQKIRWVSMQQNQFAELRLNPPNLGPLDVMLKISDNQATALFASPHGAVRDAVENALPKLREILADNGIVLGSTTISDQSPRERNMGGFMNQDSGTAAQRGASLPAGDETVAAQTVTVRRHNGMVDTFA